MKSAPVTAYVPAYNSAHFLREVVEALLAQSIQPAEIIVIDDASTDNTAEVLRSLPVRVVCHPGNRGLAAARNTALQTASHAFLAGVDSDVVAERYWLERLLDELRAAGAAAAGGRLMERNVESAADRWRARVMKQHHGESSTLNVLIYGSNGVFETAALRAIGGWNERYRRAYDDVDITERLLASGRKTVYVPDALCWHIKTDTIRSVTDSAYNWRLPAFEERGALDELTKLASRWVVSVRFDIAELQDLDRCGDGELAYVTYVGLFRSILRDLIEFNRRHPDILTADDVNAGTALLVRALSRNAPPPIVRGVLDELSDLLELRGLTDLAQQAGRCDGEKAAELLMRLAIRPGPGFPVLATALESLPDVIPMPPALKSALDNAAR